MRDGRKSTARRRTPPPLPVALAAALLAAVLAAGCGNDPFDPSTVENQRPVARIFISAVDPDGELNPTSYYRRTFSWSGTDTDGFVEEFFVSIAMTADGTAPWDTTAATDTTMTFSTDDQGEAIALVKVACRDDRGAVSDTVSQLIPLRNFPPVINFQADFDTFTWSYGAASMRLFAIDLDGNETMSDSVTYYLDTADTLLAPMPEGEPGADPNLRPVRMAIQEPGEGLFEIGLPEIATPGERTLTVRVADEADADARFLWTWDVLPANGPVLVVDDMPGDYDLAIHHAAMDDIFGRDNWSCYDMEDGLPDRLWVFGKTLEQFEAVFWYTGSTPSYNLRDATLHLAAYLNPEPGSGRPAGKLLLVSKSVIGSTTLRLPSAFVQGELGVNQIASPVSMFVIPQDKLALSLRPTLPDLVPDSRFGTAIGMSPMNGAEAIYQMEYSRYTTRPPFEPFVGVRIPTAAEGPARAVTLSVQLEFMTYESTVGAIAAILGDELEVALP